MPGNRLRIDDMQNIIRTVLILTPNLLQARVSMRVHLSADLDELMRDVLASPHARHARSRAAALDPAQDPEPKPVGREAMRNCVFGAYMQPELRPADRMYTEITDPQALLSTLEAYMAEHDGVSLLQLVKSS